MRLDDESPPPRLAQFHQRLVTFTNGGHAARHLTPLKVARTSISHLPREEEQRLKGRMTGLLLNTSERSPGSF